MAIQEEGIVRLGANAAAAVDVAEDVISVRYKIGRKTVTSAPTWGDASENDLAGAFKNTVEIEFKNSAAADRLNLLLIEAAQTGVPTQYLGWAFDDAAIGAGNLLYSTTITVMGADLGGKAGDENTQRYTYPAGPLASTSTDPIT